MKLKASVVVVALLLVVSAFGRDDREWVKFSVSGSPFGEGAFENVLISCEQELKFDNSRLYEQKTVLMAGYRFSPYFAACIGHRFGTIREGEPHTFKTEHRPTADLLLYAPEFCTLRPDVRLRFEYRDRHGMQGYMRYRARFQLRTSWSISDFIFSPYVSEELFFSDKPKRDDADLFDQNRVQAGLAFKPIPSMSEISCRLFFMVRHDMSAHSSTWTPTNIYGFEIGYRF